MSGPGPGAERTAFEGQPGNYVVLLPGLQPAGSWRASIEILGAGQPGFYDFTVR